MTAIELIKKRRTVYALGKNLTQNSEELTELIFTVVENAPSAFNSQSSRLLVLLDNAHHYFWDKIVLATLKKIAGNGDFAATDKKIKSFAAAFGTVLFFEDLDTVKQLQAQFPLYAEHFPAFSEQSSGMAQLAVWTALAAADIGASLQHYNPLIDDAVKARWHLPAGWVLRAQMPFGSVEIAAGAKVIRTRSGRFQVAAD